MFGLSGEKPLVGLDIGSHGVKALELRTKRKGKTDVFAVARAGYAPLPPDAIVEGAIIDSAAVVETIKAVFAKAKITNKDVVISISGNAVIIKKIALPAMENEELAESIIWEAKHNIPYPYEETSVDYAILKPKPGEDRNLEILLVAVKKDKIAAYSHVINQARKNLVAIEVDAFALFNALEANYPEEFAEKTTALVNLGANLATIVIIERGVPQLFRDLSVGGLYFIENLRKDFNLGHDEAEGLLQGIDARTVSAAEVESVLAANLKGLIEEVEKTLGFFTAEDKREKRIEELFLSGGLANFRNIAAAFEQKLLVPTALFDPFRKIAYNDKKLNPAYSRTMAPFFAVSAGLATRKREK
ncbi:MAG: type IV pilus assembly protein PilM [Candidatus Aminicenantes bacterium]|nr:type IV pilus assembly protein PilM [Candidatus Aminicenantes bacterium]